MSHDDPSMGSATPSSSESHGVAALLLVESLIHGLCENRALSAGQATEIAERAVEVQFDKAAETEGTPATMWQSHALLTSIAASLKADSDGDGDVEVPDGASPLDS